MSGRDLGSVPGAGAAGGLAFGLMAFCSARPVAGFDLFARESRLQQRIGAFDLVVTGEGSLDPSTCMGKGVDGVAQLCRRHQVPCVALAGVVKPCAALRQRFSWMGGLTELTSETEAKAFPRKWLKRLAARAARETLRGNSPST
jgi:glycerate kinase